MSKQEELFKAKLEELQKESAETVEELKTVVDKVLVEIADKTMEWLEGYSFGVMFGRKGKQLCKEASINDPTKNEKIMLAGCAVGRSHRDIMFAYVGSQLGPYGGIAVMFLKSLGFDVEDEEEK